MEFIIGDYIYCVHNSGQVSPRVADTTKTSYGDIPATVKYNGTTYTIKDLEGWSGDSTSGYTAKGTFYKCKNLLVAPSLPNTVTDMTNTFNGCSSLTTPPTIPSGVTRMSNCFTWCSALVTPPIIPSTVTNMSGCFQGCSSLASAPNIPNGVTNLSYCFNHCSALTTPPIIPSTVTNMSGCFQQCFSLANAPNIPNGVTKINNCFGECTSLVTPPTIPSTVTNIEGCFRGCSSLTTAPQIPSGITKMNDCFNNCSSLTTAPDIPSGVVQMIDCFKNCSSLTTAPNIPSGVDDMFGCFDGCSSLTAAPDIPSSVTNMVQCFKGCSSLTAAAVIPSSVTNISDCFEGCVSLTEAPNIPSGVIYMTECFKDCVLLATAPAIPSSVVKMYNCFMNCTSLKTAPVIPSSVTDITAAFFGCSSLDGVITVHGEPTAYTNAFYGTKKPIYIYDDYIGGENFWTNIASTYSNVHCRLKDVPPSNTTITAYRVEHDGDEIPYKQGQYVFVRVDTKYSAENTPNETVITAQTPSLSMDNHDITPTWATTQSEGRSVSKAWVEPDDFLQHTLSASQTIQYSVPNLFSDNRTSPASSVILEKLYALINAFHDEESGTEGIAFGTLSTMPNSLLVAMDAYFMDKNNVMRALFDFVYPIGSYYETSDTSFDPNDTWGGTWVLEAEGQVHVSAGTNYAVSGALTNASDGGEATHLLTVDEMPSHNHNFSMWGNGTHYYPSSGSILRWYSSAYNTQTVTVSNTGGGQAHNNMQPYIIVNRWHRTA